jgi:hypothetical protein
MDHGAVECERKKDVSSFVLGAEKGCGRVWGAAAPTQEGADAVWLSRAVQMGGRSVFFLSRAVGSADCLWDRL